MSCRLHLFKCLQCSMDSFGRADRIRSGRKKFCSHSCRSKFYGAGSRNPYWSGRMLAMLNHVDDARGLPLLVRTKIRVWMKSKIEIDPETECWNWMSPNGKPMVALANLKITTPMPRLAYALFKGAVGSLFVLHSCDNPACINPKHLWLGTQQDNMDDMSKKSRGKGKAPPGERNGAAVLSTAIILEMRRRYVSRHPLNGQSAMAREFCVSQAQVGRVVRGENWKHV